MMKKKIYLFILFFMFIPTLVMAQYTVPFWQFKEYATASWGALDPNGTLHQIGVDENGKLCFKYKDGTVTKFTSSSGGAEINKDLTITGTTPQVKIGDGDQEDTSILFDGNAQDFYIALDDTTDDLTIGTGSTIGSNAKMVVENGGNIGIGTTSPAAKLHLLRSTAAGTPSINSATVLTLQGNADESSNTFMSIIAGTTGNSTLLFGNTNVEGTGRVNYNHNNNSLGFYTNANERITINSSGNVAIGTLTPTSLLDLQKSGTAKSNVTLLELTNSVNAADMDGTETEILANQYYYDPNTPAVADMAKIVFGTEQDWTSTASTQDAYVSFKTVLNGTMTEHARLTSAGTWTVQGYNGAALNLNKITEEVTIPVGSGADPVVLSSSNLAPAGSLIMGVTFRVTDAPGGGAATIDIGRTNGGNLDEFIDGASCDVLGETGDNYTNGDTAHTGIQRNNSADTFTLTTDADVTDNEMKVRIIVWYRTITVPTS